MSAKLPERGPPSASKNVAPVASVTKDVSPPEFAVAEKGSEIALEWGSWSEDMAVADPHQGFPCIQSLENKGLDKAPTARLGLAIPDVGTAEWQVLLVSAKGLVSVGLERRTLPIGGAYRKSENRDCVWYYTTDGVLRNGARSVGKKGPTATTRDVITITFHRNTLSFKIGADPATAKGFSESLTDIKSGTFALSVQLHRKGDRIAVISEKFDAWTLAKMQHSTWGTVSQLPSGQQAAKLKTQQTAVCAVQRGSDFMGGTVPAGAGALVVKRPERTKKNPAGDKLWRVEWEVQVTCLKSALYIGVERDGYPTGHDWWSDEAVDWSWYYASEGSFRNGSYVVAEKKKDARRAAADVLDLEGDEDDEEEEEDETGSEASDEEKTEKRRRRMRKRSSLIEMDEHELAEAKGNQEGGEGAPEEEGAGDWEDIPVLKEGDALLLVLEENPQDNSSLRLWFAVNGRRVPESIPVTVQAGTGVRLAVQMEAEGDEVMISPNEGSQDREG